MLSDLAIRKAQPRDKDYKLHDSSGLYLFVTKGGVKSWRFDYRFADKRRTATIGRYPETSLADARAARDQMRMTVGRGADPIDEIAKTQARAADEAANTFGRIADEFVQRMRDKDPPAAERTVAKSEWILTRLVGPDLRVKPIRSVTSADVFQIITRLSESGRRETAKRSRAVISAVFRHAIATLRADTDPCHVLMRALPPPKVKHMAAITDEAEFGRLLSNIEESTGWWSVRLYIQFLALTFVRPGEARLAKWHEVDMVGAVWHIPAERMKMRRPHDVPLSTQALDVLRAARAADPFSELLFPSLRTNRKPLSDNAANSALRKMGYTKDQMVSHGFRSSASTILNSRKFDRDAIEMQLAHAPDDRIRAIYNRDKMWDERVRLMQRWADLLDLLKML